MRAVRLSPLSIPRQNIRRRVCGMEAARSGLRRRSCLSRLIGRDKEKIPDFVWVMVTDG